MAKLKVVNRLGSSRREWLVLAQLFSHKQASWLSGFNDDDKGTLGNDCSGYENIRVRLYLVRKHASTTCATKAICMCADIS